MVGWIVCEFVMAFGFFELLADGLLDFALLNFLLLLLIKLILPGDPFLFPLLLEGTLDHYFLRIDECLGDELFLLAVIFAFPAGR